MSNEKTKKLQRKIQLHVGMFYIGVALIITGASVTAIGVGPGCMTAGFFLVIFHGILAILETSKEDKNHD